MLRRSTVDAALSAGPPPRVVDIGVDVGADVAEVPTDVDIDTELNVVDAGSVREGPGPAEVLSPPPQPPSTIADSAIMTAVLVMPQVDTDCLGHAPQFGWPGAKGDAAVCRGGASNTAPAVAAAAGETSSSPRRPWTQPTESGAIEPTLQAAAAAKKATAAAKKKVARKAPST